MLTYQALVIPGDKVVVVAPAWPNIENAARIVGANVGPSTFIAARTACTGSWILKA